MKDASKGPTSLTLAAHITIYICLVSCLAITAGSSRAQAPEGLPVPQDSPASNPGATATPALKNNAASKSKATAAPTHNANAASKSKATAAPTHNANAASKSKATAAPTHNANAASKSKATAAPSHNANAASKSKANAAPKHNANAPSKSKANAAPTHSANAPSKSNANAETSTPMDPPAAPPPLYPWRPDALGGRDPLLWEKALQIQYRAVVIDGHNDITTDILNNGFDLGRPTGRHHTDLERMFAGGLSAEFFAIYVNRKYAEHPNRRIGGAARRALDMIDITMQQIERYPNELMLATSAADIRQARKDRKIAILMGIEGGHAIENSLFALRSFYRLGVRYMTLTHANNNDWADASGVESRSRRLHGGLTDFGEKVVREMQRIGMLVDVSHVSDETFDDVLRIAQAPVIASHSSARAVAWHYRNLDDEMLREMAANGGIVMANFYATYLDAGYNRAVDSYRKEIKPLEAAAKRRYSGDPARMELELEKVRTSRPYPIVPLSKLIDHIDHIVQVAGIDHVGLGSDFDGVPALPQGIRGIDDLPNITYALLERGYSEEDILKILGSNFLRVFEEAEAFSMATGTTLSGDGDTSGYE